MRESFIFYRSFYESIKELESDIQSEIYNAIMEYQFNGKEVKLSGVSKSIFTLIKPQLEANNIRYKNGKKGGRPKTELKPNNNQKETEMKPNENENVNVNENDIKENTKRKIFKPPTLEEVEDYCKQRNSPVDAKAFYEYFETGGWVDSKGNKVKNWKQKIITWENNRKPKEDKTPEWFNENNEEEEVDDETRRLIEEIEGTSTYNS